MTPDGKTFDPETVTDKQLVQYEQAIDRGLTEADALRLAEHEYNGFQANAIIAAALNPAVGEDVLDALATPKYTAAQMTAIAKIAIRGGDFARFLDPQMDARRMEAAYLVVAHGGSDLPVERLSRSQLLTINNILLQGHVPYETVRAIAKPAFTPESMEVIAAAMENARHDPYTGEHSLTEAQVARIMNPEYRPEQQIALLTAMRGQTPVADLSDADFAGLFPASLSVEQMSACAYAVNRCGHNTPLLMMTMQACADMNAQQSVNPEAGRRLSMISGTVSLRAATTFPWRATTAHPAGTRSRRMHLQWMRPERMTRTSDRTRSDKKLKDRMPHPVWERHLHKCEKEREVRMMKAEKGSEIITTICEYENSVAMPDNERLTYLDTCGIARLKDGNGNVKAQEAYANRCSEYLRFGHEVDLAACGAYSPYDALKVCDTPEIFLKTGFEQRPMLYTQKHLFQALTPKSDYNPHRHGFSIEQVKRFPELLASPVVLANSPTRDDVLLAILLATDAYDTPLIAGIKPDGTGNYGEREVETNMVLSVYSRQNFIRYFALLRDMDAFVFVSGRKIEALEDLSGLPLAENCSGLDIDRILQRPKCLG